MSRSFIFNFFLYFIISSFIFIVPFVLGAFCHLFNKRILDWIAKQSPKSDLIWSGMQENSHLVHDRALSRLTGEFSAHPRPLSGFWKKGTDRESKLRNEKEGGISQCPRLVIRISGSATAKHFCSHWSLERRVGLATLPSDTACRWADYDIRVHVRRLSATA